MKTIPLYIILFSVLVSCQRDDSTSRENQDPILVERRFCEASPQNERMKWEHEYSADGLLKSSHYFGGGVETSESYTYDARGNLEQKVRIEKRRIVVEEHEYDAEKRLLKIHSTFHHLDSNGVETHQSDSEQLFEYENEQLVKKTENWGGFISYEYSGDLLTKMTTHRNNGDPHHITSYKYKGGRLKTEVKETREGNVMYTRKYCYDARKRLESVIEDKELVEEYIYKDNRLVRKNEWYYGIDPGYDFCNGNYITLYEY